MTLQELKNALVKAAEKAGVATYEIYFQKSEELSAGALKDEINSFSSGVSGGLCFRCIVDGKMGYASGELLTEDAMEDLVKRAIANAKCIDSEDEAIIFAGSPSYLTTTAPVPQLADPSTIRELALALQKDLYAACDKVGDGTRSQAVSVVSEVYLYNSYGLELSNRGGATGATVSPVLRQDGEAQSGFEFGLGSTYEDVKDLPQKALAKALDKFGAALVPTGRYDVVIDGKQFYTILSAFTSVFSAKNAQLGLSLLAGKEGEVIASPCVSIYDDPMRPESPMQTAFD
ncbi:MAG: hypothetical protein J6R42_02990, partial [Clostridia bacterium]|nr:hypothetical protein [Clostridia bacterium]